LIIKLIIPLGFSGRAKKAVLTAIERREEAGETDSPENNQ
jgi:hypothetical protein